MSTIIKALEKIRLRGDLSSDALNYLELRSKIRQALSFTQNLSGYTKTSDIKLQLLHWKHILQTLAQKVRSYIKDTNHFLSNIKKLGSLPDGAKLSTMDVFGLYPNIPNGEGLVSLRKFFETRDNKKSQVIPRQNLRK